MLDILHEEFVMPLHFFSSFSTNCPGYIMPTVGCVPVINSQSPFKGFVLLSSPRARTARGHGA
ncbi:hypothetical protein NC652_011568 [Populus alba x Populus x berolinensis]|nr:hypothetical protein NC652_011568 [Populus alba x Populus x berolinensis]